jgi:hypothetical protein
MERIERIDGLCRMDPSPHASSMTVVQKPGLFGAFRAMPSRKNLSKEEAIENLQDLQDRKEVFIVEKRCR